MSGTIMKHSYPKYDFDQEQAFNHLRAYTADIRTVDSPHYNNLQQWFFQIFSSRLSSRDNTYLNMGFQLGTQEFSSMPFSFFHHIQTGIRNIQVEVSPKNSSKTLPDFYMMCHYDSTTAGVGAYDDAISCAAMIEVMHTLISTNRSINMKIHFTLIGSEEYGLHGSSALAKNCSISGYYLNLEGMGGSRPYALLKKANKSSSVIRAYSKVRGALLGTFANDILSTGIIRAGSDSDTLSKCGLYGAESAFLGNPSTYHTIFDQPNDPEDLSVIGNTILDFIYNFETDNEETDLVAIGIAPLAIVVSKPTLKLIGSALAIAGFTTICFVCPLKSFGMTLVKFAGSSLLTVITCVIMAYLQYVLNSLSYGDAPWTAFVIFSVLISSILSCYLIRFKVGDNDSWFAVKVFVDSVFVILLRETDISVVFIFSLFTSLIVFFIRTKSNYVAAAIEIIGFWPTSFVYVIVFKTTIGYSTMIPGFLGESYPYLFMCYFVLRAALTVLPFVKDLEVKSLKSINPIYVLSSIITVIFFYFIFKSFPYGDDYLIKGTYGHYFYPNKTSEVHFFPEVGNRVVSHIDAVIKRGMNIITFIPDHYRPLHRGPAYVQRFRDASLPNFVDHWPLYSFNETKLDGNKRQIGFTLDEGKTTANQLSFLIKCPNIECVSSIEGYEEFKHVKTVDSNFTVAVRISPIKEKQSYSFVLNITEPVPVDILFGYWAPTQERIKFFQSFPRYITVFGKERYLSDVQLYNTTMV